MRTIPLPPPIITFLIIAAAITGLTVYWAKNGPIKATHEWAAIRPTADANIPQQITRSIRWIYARHGILTKYPTGLGKCQAIIFDEPVFMFSMPNDIHIWGNSTEGRWIGEFYPKTGKYEVTINILGGKHTVSGQYDDYPMQVDNVAVDDKLMIPPPDPND